MKFAGSLYEESIYEKWQAGTKDEDKGEGLIKSRQAGIPGRRCHGVALAKTVKKSFGNEKEKVER